MDFGDIPVKSIIFSVIILYIANYLVGKKNNKKISEAWFSVAQPILVKSYPNTSNSLM